MTKKKLIRLSTEETIKVLQIALRQMQRSSSLTENQEDITTYCLVKPFVSLTGRGNYLGLRLYK